MKWLRKLQLGLFILAVAVSVQSFAAKAICPRTWTDSTGVVWVPSDAGSSYVAYQAICGRNKLASVSQCPMVKQYDPIPEVIYFFCFNSGLYEGRCGGKLMCTLVDPDFNK